MQLHECKNDLSEIISLHCENQGVARVVVTKLEETLSRV